MTSLKAVKHVVSLQSSVVSQKVTRRSSCRRSLDTWALSLGPLKLGFRSLGQVWSRGLVSGLVLETATSLVSGLLCFAERICVKSF